MDRVAVGFAVRIWWEWPPNLIAVASNLIAMAFNRIAIAMASKLNAQ